MTYHRLSSTGQPGMDTTLPPLVQLKVHAMLAGASLSTEYFQNSVRARDPYVAWEFVRHYVAFIAETKAVAVVPKPKGHRLSSNMAFVDITYPNKMCKDVTGLERWGNGDMEVGLKLLDELPHVMGLVRQFYERQIGNGGQG